MNWTEQIDGYCERHGPEFWAEPINAVTNIAFLIAALIMWRRGGPPIALLLCIILAAIGVGSFLFHTFATSWAALTDVVPIGLFILAYIYAANLHYLRWPVWAAALGTAAFIPYAALTVPIFGALPFFNISAGYWPVALLIALYAVFLWRRLPATARGLALGSGILCLSLTLRSIDELLCHAIPIGTHFWWHILNAMMLGWMIEVLRRHHLAAKDPSG